MYFQKNLDVLKVKNPELAKQLEGIELSSINDIYASKADSNDFIIDYKDVPLHSSIDPIREAKTVWNRAVKRELQKNDIQIVFGLGLGYLFKRSFVNAESKVFLIEPITDILRFVLEYVDFSQEFADDRVFITNSVDELCNKLNSEFFAGNSVEFLYLNSYASIAQSSLVEITQRVIKICESKSNNQTTIFNTSKTWTQNSLLNLPYFTNALPIEFLENKLNKSAALIVASGPSLSENIEKIKQNQNKFIKIAVGSAFKPLIDAGITPDFVTFVNPDSAYQQVKGYENYLEKTNVIIESRADNEVFKLKAKSKILFLSDSDNIASWMNTLNQDALTIHKAGGTSSIIAYYFAKTAGCNPIIFTGLDLAFVDNKINANNTPLEVDEEGNVKLTPYSNPKKVIQIDGVKGNLLYTIDDYAMYARNFEEIFAEPMLTKVINTSTSGALIKGVEYKEFEEALNSIGETKTEDINDVISKAMLNNKDTWFKQNKNVAENLKLKLNEINAIKDKVQPTLEVLKEIQTMFEEDGKNPLIQTKIDSIKSDLVELRDKVIQEVFLSYYLQKEIWKYAKEYKTSIIPSADDIKTNLILEYEFYNAVTEAVNNVEKWLTESVKKYENTFAIA